MAATEESSPFRLVGSAGVDLPPVLTHAREVVEHSLAIDTAAFDIDPRTEPFRATGPRGRGSYGNSRLRPKNAP